MTRLLLILLIGSGVGLGVLFANGILQVNTAKLPFMGENVPPLSPTSTPELGLVAVPTTTPVATPTIAPPASPTPVLTADISISLTPTPTPTLTPPQVFALLDAGKISVEEAKAMLMRQSRAPTPTSEAPQTPVAPTPTPSVEIPAASESVSLERGSVSWTSELEKQVHILTNQERQRQSVPVLEFGDRLSGIARGHSQDMASLNYFDHTNPSGQSPSDRAAAAMYRCFTDYGTYYTQGIAENIFQTYLYSSITYLSGVPTKDYRSLDQIAQQVVDGWMQSPGHRQNILNGNYDKEGIGVAVSPDEEVYVTQNFC